MGRTNRNAAITALLVVICLTIAIAMRMQGREDASTTIVPALATSIEPIATRAPIQIRTSGSLVPRTVEELTREADLIVIGTIETFYPSRWNTADGELPANTTVNNISPDLLIYTDAAVQIEQLLKGESEEQPVRVRVLGGSVGADSMLVEGEPEFKPGQRVLLFLTREDVMTGEIGPPHYTVRGLMQGAYEIVGDRAISRVHEASLDELLAIIAENQ